ncbi:hypothetical protein BYT27DRAFT_7308101 [Phlegmacium glaucopus]|nr:hypothetical protein BYT27DRAFT_7308101 [Phlegmacium glaucopus]
MTVSPTGRKLPFSSSVDVLKADSSLKYPLAKVVSFTEHEDNIRRGGVASTIKNGSFHAPGHRAILSPESETIPVAPGIDALPYSVRLFPLPGSEEFDLEMRCLATLYDQEKFLEPLQFLPPAKACEPDATGDSFVTVPYTLGP